MSEYGLDGNHEVIIKITIASYLPLQKQLMLSSSQTYKNNPSELAINNYMLNMYMEIILTILTWDFNSVRDLRGQNGFMYIELFGYTYL